MSEANFILRRGEWRFFKNNLGDSLYDIQALLALPHEKVNFYCSSSLESYEADCPKLVDMLRIFDCQNKVNLIDPGIKVPEDSKNTLYNIRIMSKERRRPDVKLKLEINENALTPDYDFLKNFNYNLDFSKTVAWNRRPMKKKDKNIKFRFLSELPPKVLDRWSGYNFINLGSQFGEGDVYDYLFDLDTSIWLLKECAAYVGSDSGTTHLAMAVKDPKDIYLYGENPEGEKTKTIWSMNSYENTGINFLV